MNMGEYQDFVSKLIISSSNLFHFSFAQFLNVKINDWHGRKKISCPKQVLRNIITSYIKVKTHDSCAVQTLTQWICKETVYIHSGKVIMAIQYLIWKSCFFPLSLWDLPHQVLLSAFIMITWKAHQCFIKYAACSLGGLLNPIHAARRRVV